MFNNEQDGPMWNLDDALKLIDIIQPQIKIKGYFVMLGGGVLNKRESNKDLDLFFAPFNGEYGNRKALFSLLMNIMTYKGAIRDSSDYGPGNIYHWDGMERMEFENKQVDIFILK